ncbi:MAG: hypothetical protein HFJ66_01535 [Eggerthellaceae bacterium]|nr:hypothetical protein [Eggerthellaceae bacterium]
MKDRVFKTALWGYSWDDVLGETEGDCCQGIAKLEDGRISLDIPFGQLLSEPFVLVVGGNSLPQEANYLYGFSQDGFYIALSDAQSGGTSQRWPGAPHQTIIASQILASKQPFDPNARVYEARVKLTGLREWFGRAPYSATHTEDRKQTTYKVNLGNTDLNCELYASNELRIVLYHEVAASQVNQRGFNVSHDCFIRFTFRNLVNLDDAVRTVARLAEYLSACVGFDASIENLEAKLQGSESYISCYRPFIEGRRPSATQMQNLPLSHTTLGKYATPSINHWLSAPDDFADIEQRLCSLLFKSWTLPLDLTFIAASQLLESISKYDTDTQAMPEDEYERFKALVMHALDSTIDDPRVRTWAKERVSGNTKGQTRLLRDLIGKHQTFCEWLIPDTKAFVRQQTAARNHFIHRGGPAEFMPSEKLYWHTEIVLVLCYGFILEESGIPSDTLIEALEQSRFKASAIAKAKTMYGA